MILQFPSLGRLKKRILQAVRAAYRYVRAQHDTWAPGWNIIELEWMTLHALLELGEVPERFNIIGRDDNTGIKIEFERLGQRYQVFAEPFPVIHWNMPRNYPCRKKDTIAVDISLSEDWCFSFHRGGFDFVPNHPVCLPDRAWYVSMISPLYNEDTLIVLSIDKRKFGKRQIRDTAFSTINDYLNKVNGRGVQDLKMKYGSSKPAWGTAIDFGLIYKKDGLLTFDGREGLIDCGRY